MALPRNTNQPALVSAETQFLGVQGNHETRIAVLEAEAIPLDLPLNSVIDPTNSHTVLRFDDTVSGLAVNYLTATNSDTGTPVVVSADGTDTDIGVDILAKGLGLVRANGSRVETYSNKNIASGYAGLDGSAKVAPAQLPVFTSVAAGVAPASGGGTTNFLRADGTWAAPAGGGGGSGLNQPAVMARMAFGGF
jgi:hypothetical protein